MTDATGDLLGGFKIGFVQKNVPSDEDFAGSDGDRSGGRVGLGIAEIGQRKRRPVSGAADVGEIATMGKLGGGFI